MYFLSFTAKRASARMRKRYFETIFSSSHAQGVASVRSTHPRPSRAAGAVVVDAECPGDLSPSEGVKHLVEGTGRASLGFHRQDHDLDLPGPVPDERRVLLRLSREAHVDGVCGVRMIPF